MTGEAPGADAVRPVLPRAARITGSEEIRTIFRRGKRRRTRHLDVLFLPSPFGVSRLGVVVGKHRQTAVLRNRLKRRLREIGRIDLLPQLTGAGVALDLLIRARPEAYRASFVELRREATGAVEEILRRERG